MSKEESLNELRKATLASYLAKAGTNVRTSTSLSKDFEGDYYNYMAAANRHHPLINPHKKNKDPVKRAEAEAGMQATKHWRDVYAMQAKNRIAGISRAGRILAGQKISPKHLEDPAKAMAKERAKAVPYYAEETINERNTESHPELWNTHELRHESGKALKKGDVIKDFRGDKHKIKGFELPHHSGSTGRVYTSQGSFFPGVVDAKIVRKKVVKEDVEQVNEAREYKPGDKVVLNRDYAGQHAGLVFTVHHTNANGDHWIGRGKDHSGWYVGAHQIRPWRGKKVSEETEQVDEVSRSTIVKITQARYNQAQKALKDKDYGGYVKFMRKAMKAGDATVPKTGWSHEEDPKSEEVSPVEKYRQIREAKVKKSRKRKYGGDASTYKTQSHNWDLTKDTVNFSVYKSTEGGIPLKHHIARLAAAGIPSRKSHSPYVGHTALEIPKKHEKKAAKILYGEEVSVDEQPLDEVSAPGQEAWIKANKQRFIDQYGKEKGLRVLYAKAWKMSKQDSGE